MKSRWTDSALLNMERRNRKNKPTYKDISVQHIPQR